MARWGRMLAVALVLATSGALQAAEAAFACDDDCADEAQSCDCSASCASACRCCPARASLPAPGGGAAGCVASFGPVLSRVGEPVVATDGADIFHPPRA